jgi:RHS repeat-associated protein
MELNQSLQTQAVRKRISGILLAALFVGAQVCPALAFQHRSSAIQTRSVKINTPVAVQKPPSAVKTGPRKVTLFTPKVSLGDNPSDLEISSARIFSEPLTPMSGTAQAGENSALAAALKAFLSKPLSEDLSALTDFVQNNPTSRWVPSVNARIADFRYNTGYLSTAYSLWQSIWNATKSETGRAQKAVADQAIANFLILNARLGRADELKKYFAEIEKRPFFGADEVKVVGAQQGYRCMQSMPERAFKCGPYGLNNLLLLEKDGRKTGAIKGGINPVLEKAASTRAGTNLAELQALARQSGLNYKIVKRSAGSTFVSPSLMHWKLNHFAAITATKNGKYQIQDPTFDHDGLNWVSTAALEAETDGYFMISADLPLPAGWSELPVDEAKSVWGKGAASGACQECKGCVMVEGPHCSGPICKNAGGMARAGLYPMQATLSLADTPLSYAPPVGPDPSALIKFDHLTPHQPSTFTFTNLGHDWLFDWLSYLTVDPVTSVATVRLRSGGVEVFTPDIITGLYPPALLTQATLVLISPGVYERRMPDGSKTVYNQSDASTPARIFMTEIVDKAGISAYIQYDANFRITSFTDGIGQVSTVSYISNTLGNVGFYKIASLTDPFGRSCTFAYDATTTLLLSITDMIGMKSSFTYDSGASFITTMTTPYGTTSFYQYVPGYLSGIPAQGLKTTYPDGTWSVVESWLDTSESTYYWDRHATQLYPSDPANKIYTHCEKTQWVINTPGGLLMPLPHIVTHPLESASPITNLFVNQPSPTLTGTSNKITQSSRSLGNPITIATVAGTLTVGDIFYLSADGQGGFYYTVQPGDTFASIAANLVATTNSNTSMQTAGVTAVQASATSFSLQTDNPSVTQFKVYPNPGVTTKLDLRSQSKQSAQVTIGGTMTIGDTVNVDINLPHPNNFTERITHTVVGGDTPTAIAADMAAKINANPLLALAPTTATSAGPIIYITSFSSKVTAYSPFVTGATTETIAVSEIRNGSVQLYSNKYNNLGLVTESIDPVGRKFTYVYDSNNIDLLQKKETQGTDNYQMSAWTYNAHHMPLTHTDGSGRITTYTYNSLQQPLTVTDADSNVTTMTYTGTSSATIGGTVTAGNVLTITVHDPALSGGLKAVNYTVVAGNTLTTIATGLKNAINADASLQAIGVSATSSAAVITMKSTSVNVTTYTQSVSVGSTETIALGSNTFGYLTQIDGPLAGNKDITTFLYDGYGRLYSQTSSTGYTLTYTYDAMNRRIKTTYPDGTSEQIVWDRLDEVMTKDRNGRWSQKAFDSMDDLVYEIDPLGRKTQYTWCTCGSMITLTDPANNTTTWQHDLQGRITRKIYADSTAINYAYDPNSSNLRSRMDALSQKTVYSYYPDDKSFQKTYINAVNPTAAVTTIWDPYFERVISAYKPDWGTISYSYNPYILPGGSATTGGGRLQLIHNDRMANSDITFVYDNLGRQTNRSINGAANSDTWAFDAAGRVTSEVNALGTFNFAYVDDTSGSSKGSSRLASVTYPNSQVSKYSWYQPAGDERLQQIANLKTNSGPSISQFGYGYDPSGQITQWQQLQGNSSVNLNLGYDEAGQLTSSQTGSGGPSASYLKQDYFAYDVAANRTGVQQNSVNRVKFGGTVTTGNTLTITVKDSSLTGGQEAVTYTVVGGDTLSTIATKLAAAITANANLMALGVNASANGSMMSIKAASANITTYAQSTNVGATETITLGVTNNFVENAVISGTKTTGNTLTITVMDAALSGGSASITYTVLAGDTLTTMTTGLKNAINANAGLAAAGITATSVGTVITIKSTSSNATTYSQSTSAGATASIALSINQNGPQTIAIAGTKTTGDTITITVYDAGLAGGLKAVTYTVLAGDTLATIASGIASALTADSALQGIGVSASSSGKVVTLESNSISKTIMRATTSAAATETIALNIPANGVQTAVIGGTKTTGDIVTVTAHDAALIGGSQAVSYTVLAGDTLTSIATGLAAAITANANLSAIGVSATSSSTVVNIKSTSINATTYVKSTSGGATATIALAPASSVTQYNHNNVNELTSIAAGGATRFQATTNKALKSATVNSFPATFTWSQEFNGNAVLASGANNVPVSATDGASNVVTNNYQVGIRGPGTTSLTFDANGSMTSDGVKTFAWDADNRLIKITYPGSGNFSEILYDASGIKGQITETVASSLASTKQFLNAGSRISEERDASSNVVKKFFDFGQTISGANYFYFFDHLGSIREMNDNSGVVQARYEYDTYGQRTKTAGALDADFQYAGYYMHSPSGLNLTVYRAYRAELGRWINRDPIEERGGINLYSYVGNNPAEKNDALGLANYFVNQNCLGYFLNFMATVPADGDQLSNLVSRGGWVCKPQKCGKCDCGPFLQSGIAFTWNGHPPGEGPDMFTSPWVHNVGVNEYHFMVQGPSGIWSGVNGMGGQFQQLSNPDDYDNGLGKPNSRYCCCRAKPEKAMP